MCAGLNFALCVDVVCVVSSVLFLSYFMCRLLVVFSLAFVFVFCVSSLWIYMLVCFILRFACIVHASDFVVICCFCLSKCFDVIVFFCYVCVFFVCCCLHGCCCLCC